MATLLLIIIYLSFISLGLPDSILGAAWPSIYKDINALSSQAGLITLTLSGGTILSSLFSSKIIKALGVGKTVLISILMTSLALLGFSLTPNFYCLFIFAIPLGLGAGSIDTALNNFVALNYKANHMSWLHCFWGIGATSGPLIMSLFLAASSGWRVGYCVIAGIQFVLALIIGLSLPIWKKTEKENDVPIQTKFSLLAKLPGAKAIWLCFLCYCAVEATTGLWGSTYLADFHHFQEENAAMASSLFYFGITFGRLLTGFVSLRISLKKIIRIGFLFILCGISIVALANSFEILLLGFGLIGIGCAPIFPSMVHDTPRNFGESASQGMIGIQLAFAYIGTTFIPPLFGLISVYAGMAFYPIYLFLLFIFLVLCFELFNYRNKVHSTQLNSEKGKE